MLKYTGEVLKNKVTQSHSSGVRLKCILPILIDVQAIERSLRSKILKGDVGDVARPAWVSLDESNIISLDDVDVACMLGELSQPRHVL